jgi:hypothetical protein
VNNKPIYASSSDPVARWTDRLNWPFDGNTAPLAPPIARVKLWVLNYRYSKKESTYKMEEVDRMIIDYYRSDEFRQDLLMWVSTPQRSAKLRQQIVRQMNTNRTVSGRPLDELLQAAQDRFVSGQMCYEELLAFIERYIETMAVKTVHPAPMK